MDLLRDQLIVVFNAVTDMSIPMAYSFIEHGATVIALFSEDPNLSLGSVDRYPFDFLVSTGALQYILVGTGLHSTLEQLSQQISHKSRRVDALVHLVDSLPGDSSATLQTIRNLSIHVSSLMTKDGHGRIIHVGQIDSETHNRQRGGAPPPPHPLIEFTRTQALQYSQRGITTNCLLYGDVDVNIHARKEHRPPLQSHSPLLRLASPHEIAATAIFLASPLSSFVNGQVIMVDGGSSLTP